MAFIVLQKKKGIQQIRKQPENEELFEEVFSKITSRIKAKIDYIFDSIS